MRIGTAFRAFFAALFDKQVEANLRHVLDHPGPLSLPAPTPEQVPPSEQAATARRPPAAVARPQRSEAVTLLAALQREARLVDLVQEKLDQFSDAQIGAAARPCLQQCAATLERMFQLRSVVSQGEGETVEVPTDASPARYQWIGEGSSRSGRLVHHGWEAARVDIPQWTGPDADARVVAAAQVQRV